MMQSILCLILCVCENRIQRNCTVQNYIIGWLGQKNVDLKKRSIYNIELEFKKKNL